MHFYQFLTKYKLYFLGVIVLMFTSCDLAYNIIVTNKTQSPIVIQYTCLEDGNDANGFYPLPYDLKSIRNIVDDSINWDWYYVDTAYFPMSDVEKYIEKMPEVFNERKNQTYYLGATFDTITHITTIKLQAGDSLSIGHLLNESQDALLFKLSDLKCYINGQVFNAFQLYKCLDDNVFIIDTTLVTNEFVAKSTKSSYSYKIDTTNEGVVREKLLQYYNEKLCEELISPKNSSTYIKKDYWCRYKTHINYYSHSNLDSTIIQPTKKGKKVKRILYVSPITQYELNDTNCSYYFSGAIESVGVEDSCGQRQGQWIWYYKNANIKAFEYYDSLGANVGEWLYYSKKGELKFKFVFDSIYTVYKYDNKDSIYDNNYVRYTFKDGVIKNEKRFELQSNNKYKSVGNSLRFYSIGMPEAK